MFAASFPAQLEAVAQRLVEPRKNDPNLIGWFTDNELAWYPDSLFEFHLTQTPDSKTRQQLVELLRDRYEGDFAALRKDFSPDEGVSSFDELAHGGKLKLVAGGEGANVFEDFMGLLADRYYSAACSAVRKFDSAHLVLGDRYHGYCPDAVAAAAGKHVDVVSTNYDWPKGADGYLPLSYLRRLNQLSDRPVLVTEYYVAAAENRSGNPNTGELFAVVADQKQRAEVARARLRTFAEEPYIVGAHWFAFSDEPPYGRHDGEDYNFGLVDIHNEPYLDLTGALFAEHRNIERTHASQRSGYDRSNGDLLVPYVSTETRIEQMHSQLRSQIHPAAEDGAGLGDVSIAWNEDAIYVTVSGNYFVVETLYAVQPVPLSEGLEWYCSIGRGSPTIEAKIQMLGNRAAIEPESTRFEHWQRGVRYGATIAIAPPAGSPWKAGDAIKFRASLEDRRQRERSTWQRSLILEEMPPNDGVTHRDIASESERAID
jgi:hypothetical protein